MLDNKSKLIISLGLALGILGCGGGSSSSSDDVSVVEDNSGATASNNLPVISSSTFNVAEDISLTTSVNATDSDNDALSFSLLSTTTNGSLTLDGNGDFTYQPNLNFYGNDVFSVEVSDGNGTVSAELTIEVTPVNDAPVVQSVETYTRLQQAVTFSIPATDVDGDILSLSISSQPNIGSAVINENNTLTYTPAEGAEGLDEFAVTVSDGTDTVNASLSVDNGLAFKGQISLSGADIEGAQVLLTADGVLQRITPATDGSFKVYGLEDGDYSIKVRKSGYKVTAAQQVTLSSQNAIQTNATLNDETASDIESLNFELEQIDDSYFSYHWEEDQSTAGTDYSAAINQPLEIEFLEEVVEVIDDSSANQLQHDYNILLTDTTDSATWTQEHAYRILETMKSIPQETRDFYAPQTLNAAKWSLTSDYIEDDIQITEVNGTKEVIISEAAFANATPKIAKVEGKRGVFYSQRLHHALVRYVTDNGSDKDAYEKILNERFGISTVIPDYTELTEHTTGSEPATRFQEFHPEEIVQIINMFEEMPKGMHVLPELKYLVRRLDGQTHPLYPEAAAVAWPWLEQGYIEFMESAFTSSSVEHMHRLIIHEKAHFLWRNQFDQELRDEWIELGGWYEDESTSSGWATTKQTEFVSAYAHSANPNEDMAETISFFIVNPDKLRSRSVAKYEFVRDRIMQGNIYISQIQENLTFQVYNLYPDYVFPGKIKRVDISVEGQPEQDKNVQIEIELHALDTELEGAESAYLRVFSDVGTFVDVNLYAAEGDLDTVLRGSFELSKHAKAGYWRTEQIVITDAVGNQRMEGANDFGWKLYVNNPLEDVTKPEYSENSLEITKSVTQIDGQEVQVFHATWDVIEEVGMPEHNGCTAQFNDEIPETYSFQAGGSYNLVTEKCETEILMPHYMPTSTYSISQINMEDQALNMRGVYLTDPGHALRDEEIVIDELSPTIDLVTNTPDVQTPELDLNDIQISAVPTNPDAPNGETIVTVTFKVRDNISGYNIASLVLRDPQGITHQYWAYNDETWSLFPEGDPTEWQTYTRDIVLPIGSAPGTWGLAEMTIYDRASNFKGYDFTEIVHFDVLE